MNYTKTRVLVFLLFVIVSGYAFIKLQPGTPDQVTGVDVSEERWLEYRNQEIGYAFSYPADTSYKIVEGEYSVSLVDKTGQQVFTVYSQKVDSLEAATSFFLEVCEYPVPFSTEPFKDVTRIYVDAETSMEDLMKTDCFGYSAYYSASKGVVYILRNPKTGGGWLLEDSEGNPLDFEVYNSFQLL